MHKSTRLPVAVLGLAALLLAACAAEQAPSVTAANPGGAPALRAEERVHEGGAVTVKVKPAGRQGNRVVFDVVLDTHSVELAYDLVALASLKDETGQTYGAAEWQGGSGGHHVSGRLLLEGPGDAVQWLELELRDIGGVPSRIFRWDTR
jgi:hypothetical protein